MTVPYPQHQEQTIYQAETSTSQGIQAIRDHLHHLCKQHLHKLVRVETLDGDVFEGVVVGCNRGIVYLSMPAEGHPRAFGPSYYNQVILPLVLFELLVITLLYI
ncbi:hypothetical protein JCM10914A_18230 [Paenibacillus sp. JCM 10914]|uniref:hypothetical protein n=1 Tax=Bacillales TaxID=1385 RepID=UPI0003CC7A57|nr:hypothetical protein [Paenibacillus sp. JCM 10914]GAE06310.1 hypothetical protein JCM10914_2460 [Paenibacillus sp. JCM 10914]